MKQWNTTPAVLIDTKNKSHQGDSISSNEKLKVSFIHKYQIGVTRWSTGSPKKLEQIQFYTHFCHCHRCSKRQGMTIYLLYHEKSLGMLAFAFLRWSSCSRMSSNFSIDLHERHNKEKEKLLFPSWGNPTWAATTPREQKKKEKRYLLWRWITLGISR